MQADVFISHGWKGVKCSGEFQPRRCSDQSEGGGGCWAKLSPGWVVPGPAPVRTGAVCWVGMAKVNAFGSWSCREWFGLLVFNALRSEQSPRNCWWYFSDSQLWWYHTDLMCMSPQLQVWWGGVLEVGDRDIKPETLQGPGVSNSQAGEKHLSICLWVKVPEKAAGKEKK